MIGNRLTLSMALPAVLALGSTAYAALPPGGYITDFESEATCGTTCGTACPLTDVLWSNAAGDGADWTVDAGGTPSGNTGPSGDHTTGAGNYAYVEASAPCSPNVEAQLVTGDITLDADGYYRFEFWYHLFGANLGTIHVDIDPDGGADTFTNVLTLTDNLNQWQFQRVDLSAYAVGANATINIRLRGVTGSGFTSDLAVDDLAIVEYFANDVRVASVDGPSAAGCDLGMETVTVTVENVGGLSQSMFPIEFTVDGGLPVTEMFDAVIDPDTTASYTFAMPADMSLLGNHTIRAYTMLATDENTSNDGAEGNVLNGSRVLAFPHLQDFEGGGSSPWFNGGTNDTWALGLPVGNVINSAASGVMAWVTNLSGNYLNNSQSWVQSQCGYDMTTLSNPAVRLNVWWEAEFSWDGANLQASTDNGATWTDVGTLGEAYNWYTDGTINGNPGGSPIGWSGRNNSGNGSAGWVPATHLLDGLAGNPDVQLRVTFGSDGSVTDDGVGFDDIKVFDDLNSLEVMGRGPRPSLSALGGGEVDVHTLTFTTESFGQDQTVDSIAITNNGNLADAEIAAVRLWLDDGDEVFDPAFDIQVGVDQMFVNGTTTFPAAVSSLKWLPQYMFVSVDLDPAATPGTIFDSSVLESTDVVVASGDPVTLANAVLGAEYGIFGLIDTLPWSDDIGDAAAVNRIGVWGLGDYPSAAAAGPTVATVTTTADALVDLGDASIGAGPSSAPYMGVFSFPNGQAAGAIDYAFDLSGYTVADELVWLRFNWSNSGQEDDDLSNVFVSSDGGVTWDASLFRWDFTVPVAPGWSQETVDLTAALSGAGIDFSADTRIRFQAGGDEAIPADGLQIDDIWLGLPQRAALTRDALVVAAGGTDDLGSIRAAPITITYVLENTGHLPLVVDPALFATANENNVASVVLAPPATNPVDPGASVTFDVSFDVVAAGAFSLDVLFNTDDPRLAGDFSFTITGVGTVPDLAVSRAGTPVAAGSDDAMGTVSGDPQSATYTIENVGDADLTIETVSSGGANNVTVTLTQPATLVLTPGATTTFDVTYMAGDGAFSFDVMIASDDTDSPYAFTVSGTGQNTEVGGGGGCCSVDGERSPMGGLLLALFVGLALIRPRRRRV